MRSPGAAILHYRIRAIHVLWKESLCRLHRHRTSSTPSDAFVKTRLVPTPVEGISLSRVSCENLIFSGLGKTPGVYQRGKNILPGNPTGKDCSPIAADWRTEPLRDKFLIRQFRPRRVMAHLVQSGFIRDRPRREMQKLIPF